MSSDEMLQWTLANSVLSEFCPLDFAVQGGELWGVTRSAYEQRYVAADCLLFNSDRSGERFHRQPIDGSARSANRGYPDMDFREPSSRLCLQDGEVSIQFVLMNLGAVGVPFDAFVLDELVEDVVPEGTADKVAVLHAGDGLVEASR